MSSFYSLAGFTVLAMGAFHVARIRGAHWVAVPLALATVALGVMALTAYCRAI